MVEKSSLSDKQKRFVAEYLKDLSATQAAIRAGYSPESARSDGPEILSNPVVKSAIDKAIARRERRTEITQDRVLEELAELAFSDVTHYSVDDNGQVTLVGDAPKNAMRAVSSIKRKITTIESKSGETRTTTDVEIKLWDKPGTLKLAGKHVGLFPDKVEVDNHFPDGVPMRVYSKAERRVLAEKLLASVQIEAEDKTDK